MLQCGQQSPCPSTNPPTLELVPPETDPTTIKRIKFIFQTTWFIVLSGGWVERGLGPLPQAMPGLGAKGNLKSDSQRLPAASAPTEPPTDRPTDPPRPFTSSSSCAPSAVGQPSPFLHLPSGSSRSAWAPPAHLGAPHGLAHHP